MKLQKFTTHNRQSINIEMSWLQGEIKASYNRLCFAFGEPMPGDGYKTDAEWVIRFDDGTIATIYNWKNGKRYCGNNGIDTSEITNWHVGGTDKRAVRLVENAIADSVTYN